ncbi:hypothetical protein [uncultured Shewanella sp.]|uniref:hypothetical protein n=1 Tax=uncultured Shewanella sp. TaxID=173975 RepID=UPI00262BD280|nr:hypothetical protein [uncultured Shewanella sp.]
MMYIIETVSWTAKAGVKPSEMVDAVERMVSDLEKVPGFRYQSLSLKESTAKNQEEPGAPDQWLQLYYWDSVETAHNSNALMAPTTSLNHLISLIEPDTIAIDVFTPQQQSSQLSLS